MRTLSCVTIIAIAASSALAGCVADTSDPDLTNDEASAQEEVGEANQALGSCYGLSCNGLDPSATGCEADAVTRATSPITSNGVMLGQIVIRYSPSCNAVWARTVSSGGAFYLRAEITTPSFSTAQAASPAPTTALRSPMLGVTPGPSTTAVGRMGPSSGYYPYVGTVSTNF